MQHTLDGYLGMTVLRLILEGLRVPAAEEDGQAAEGQGRAQQQELPHPNPGLPRQAHLGL